MEVFIMDKKGNKKKKKSFAVYVISPKTFTLMFSVSALLE